MTSPRPRTKETPATDDDEQWTVMQVAARLSISYQTARNRMLGGVYGPTQYDVKSRRLTVSRGAVERMAARPKKRRVRDA